MDNEIGIHDTVKKTYVDKYLYAKSNKQNFINNIRKLEKQKRNTKGLKLLESIKHQLRVPSETDKRCTDNLSLKDDNKTHKSHTNLLQPATESLQASKTPKKPNPNPQSESTLQKHSNPQSKTTGSQMLKKTLSPRTASKTHTISSSTCTYTYTPALLNTKSHPQHPLLSSTKGHPTNTTPTKHMHHKDSNYNKDNKDNKDSNYNNVNNYNKDNKDSNSNKDNKDNNDSNCNNDNTPPQTSPRLNTTLSHSSIPDTPQKPKKLLNPKNTILNNTHHSHSQDYPKCGEANVRVLQDADFEKSPITNVILKKRLNANMSEQQLLSKQGISYNNHLSHSALLPKYDFHSQNCGNTQNFHGIQNQKAFVGNESCELLDKSGRAGGRCNSQFAKITSVDKIVSDQFDQDGDWRRVVQYDNNMCLVSKSMQISQRKSKSHKLKYPLLASASPPPQKHHSVKKVSAFLLCVNLF